MCSFVSNSTRTTAGIARAAGALLLAGLLASNANANAHAQSVQKSGQTYPMAVMEHNRERAASDDRAKRLAADAEHLLAMAQTLRTSVSAARRDELSLQVVRQADEIEKLARSVKDRMRQ